MALLAGEKGLKPIDVDCDRTREGRKVRAANAANRRKKAIA